MNRAERIYRIHQLLTRRRSVPFELLQQELEISPATIKRDIAYLRDYMEAPIINTRDGQGYRYDPEAPEFQLPGLWFNDSELYALLASEQLLESVRPGLLGPHIGPLKARIRKLLEQTGHTSETVTQRIRLQPIGSRQIDNQRFGRVAGAVLDGRCLDITYDGRERGQTTERRIHPYQLTHYRDNWFVIAWCEQARALRTFSLDRIRQAHLTDADLRAIDDASLDRFLNASFGIFTGEAKAWAVLRFAARAARWVADETWHPDQIGRWDGATYELQIPYSDERELLMEIGRYGPEVEVIAPEALRDKAAQRVREAAGLYG